MVWGVLTKEITVVGISVKCWFQLLLENSQLWESEKSQQVGLEKRGARTEWKALVFPLFSLSEHCHCNVPFKDWVPIQGLNLICNVDSSCCYKIVYPSIWSKAIYTKSVWKDRSACSKCAPVMVWQPGQPWQQVPRFSTLWSVSYCKHLSIKYPPLVIPRRQTHGGIKKWMAEGNYLLWYIQSLGWERTGMVVLPWSQGSPVNMGGLQRSETAQRRSLSFFFTSALPSSRDCSSEFLKYGLLLVLNHKQFNKQGLCSFLSGFTRFNVTE